ncbi:hypothetical protein CRG98_023913 [Punica granatum]|nr:hypothetical protein CRG98_023913 [Punica granatum]
MAVAHRPLLRPLCFASTSTNTEQLRTELDHLHAEAQSTRSKANSARLRLLRLSEAAENLCRQAALSVRKGKENDARELLFQKKKIMKALEKSKCRIELLDELYVKLNEAISIKETQLIGNIAVDLEIVRESDSAAVHVVSPKEEVSEVPLGTDTEGEYGGDSALKESRADLNIEEETEDSEVSLGVNGNSKDDLSNSLSEFSSYEDFLEWLDGQLKKIEGELITILKVSALAMDNSESSEKIKIQQILEFFESIRGTRKRISSIMQQKVETG